MRGRRLPGVLLLLLATAAPGALRPATCRAAFRYDLGLGAALESDDNVNLAPDTPEEGEPGPRRSTIASYYAGAHLEWEERDDFLRVDYLGAYRDQREEVADSGSAWLHRLQAELEWVRWKPFFLQVREERDRVSQYRDDREYELDNRADRNRLTLRPGLSWDVGRTGRLELALRGELETYPGAEAADEQRGLFAEVAAERRWTPLWRSSLGLEYGEVRREVGRDLSRVQASLAVTQRIAPLLSAAYSLAWRRDAFPDGGEAGGDASRSLLKGAALEGRMRRESSWRVAYEDRIETLLDGDTLRAGRASGEVRLRGRRGGGGAASLWREDRDFIETGRRDRAWGLGAEARWAVTERAALDLRGAWVRTRRGDVEGAPERSDLARAEAGVLLLLGPRLHLEAGYRHLRNDSDIGERSYRSGRWYLLVGMSLEPQAPGTFPESVSARLGTAGL